MVSRIALLGLVEEETSDYGLHLLKTKFRMNAIAFTYDWGLATPDVSRVNQSTICGKLGIEHIIRSAKYKEEKNFVRNNIMAWLKKPHLGMLPVASKPVINLLWIMETLLQKIKKFRLCYTVYRLSTRHKRIFFFGICWDKSSS